LKIYLISESKGLTMTKTNFGRSQIAATNCNNWEKQEQMTKYK